MRYEGGRYRFTTEPNLNKVVLERESAVQDAEINELIRDAIRDAAGNPGRGRFVDWVHDPADAPDENRFTVAVLDSNWRINGESTPLALERVELILNQRGSSFRVNKNQLVLLIADAHALATLRSTARTLAALRDLHGDKHRLGRFNKEQQDQLTHRLHRVTDRLPAQAVMTWRHLALLGTSSAADSTALDRIDLGPAPAGSKLTPRVQEHLASADRLLDKLAPSSLLSPRFGLLPEGTDTIELDTLWDYFGRFPNLPKLTSSQVLIDCLASGVKDNLFALVSGAAWDAPDSIIRFGHHVNVDEIVLQPGSWLVRASAAVALLADRAPADPSQTPSPAQPQPGTAQPTPSPRPPSQPELVEPSSPRTVRLRITSAPASKARDIVRTAVLPLSANAVEATVNIEVTVDGGDHGIPEEVLQLTVLEGLQTDRNRTGRRDLVTGALALQRDRQGSEHHVRRLSPPEAMYQAELRSDVDEQVRRLVTASG